MAFDREKFKKLVHYIIWKAGDADGFGATKLNKVLWFADARMYLFHKRPITGAKYIREKHGPVPHQIMPVRSELEREGKIKIWDDRHYSHRQTRFKALLPGERSAFDANELHQIDYWIKVVAQEHTATSISDLTHDDAWQVAKLGEELPYIALLATRLRSPTGAELSWALEEAKTLRLP